MSHLFKQAAHSKLYSLFRPTPPIQLFERIVSKAPSTDAVLDVGCGTGQCTEILTNYFKKVVGTDNSESQIQQAEARRQRRNLTNLQYKIDDANNPSFDNETFDVITASQCVHWFDLDKFYPACNRILRKDGLLALFAHCILYPTTGDAKIDDAFKTRIIEFYKVDIGRYWEVDQTLWEQSYRTLPVPKSGFELIVKDLDLMKHWTTDLEFYLNYIRSWSIYQHHCQDHPNDNLMGRVESDLRAICYDKYQDKPNDKITFDINLRFFLYLYKKTE